VRISKSLSEAVRERIDMWQWLVWCYSSDFLDTVLSIWGIPGSIIFSLIIKLLRLSDQQSKKTNGFQLSHYLFVIAFYKQLNVNRNTRFYNIISNYVYTFAYNQSHSKNNQSICTSITNYSMHTADNKKIYNSLCMVTINNKLYM
jgi:hypothetical protein